MCRAGICGIAGRWAGSQTGKDHLVGRSADTRSHQASAPPASRLLPPARRGTDAAFPATSLEIPSAHSYGQTLPVVALGVNRRGVVHSSGQGHHKHPPEFFYVSVTNLVASTAATSDPDLSNNDGTSAAAQVVSTVYNRPTLAGQRLPGGAFQLQLTTAPNMTVSFQASTNLADWQTLSVTNSGSGVISFIDYDAANYQNRFYRSVQ